MSSPTGVAIDGTAARMAIVPARALRSGDRRMVLEQERAGFAVNGAHDSDWATRLTGRLIRKRDGRVVPFDRSRIAHAVEMAVRAEIGCPFPDPIAAVASAQVEAVVDTVLAKL